MKKALVAALILLVIIIVVIFSDFIVKQQAPRYTCPNGTVVSSPADCPMPPVYPEKTVVDANKDNADSLNSDENAALMLALTDNGFRLFYNFSDFYNNYLSHYLTKERLLDKCSQNKLYLIEKFSKEREVTIKKVEEKFYEIKFIYPHIFAEGQRNKENFSNEQTILVDVRDKKIIKFDFQGSRNGMLLYYIFHIDQIIDYGYDGFKEEYYTSGDFNKMAEEFATSFCRVPDEYYMQYSKLDIVAISATLNPNPLDLTKEQVGVSYLTVVLNNTTGATAKNVVVTVETEASDAIVIFPRSVTIETLGKGEMRKLEDAFVISPNPEKKAVSGKYVITITTEINGQSFSEQVMLELKAV